MSARIIFDKFYTNGEYKKYRSTQAEIEENRRQNQLQRERDDQARNESAGIRTDRTVTNSNTNQAGR
jgi:hypothetical protein